MSASSRSTLRARPFSPSEAECLCTQSLLFRSFGMENDGIQRLLKAEDDAAQIIQKAREGQFSDAYTSSAGSGSGQPQLTLG